MNQMFELTDNDFKTVIINMHKDVKKKKKDYNEWKMESLCRHRKYKRQQFEASKVQYLRKKIYWMISTDCRLQKKGVADLFSKN